MVKLLIGHKGSGKTGQMVQLANDSVKESNGSIIFINKNHRLTYELAHEIRVICMEDYENITNIDEYIGFVYGIISSDHDIETIFMRMFPSEIFRSLSTDSRLYRSCSILTS